MVLPHLVGLGVANIEKFGPMRDNFQLGWPRSLRRSIRKRLLTKGFEDRAVASALMGKVIQVNGDTLRKGHQDDYEVVGLMLRCKILQIEEACKPLSITAQEMQRRQGIINIVLTDDLNGASIGQKSYMLSNLTDHFDVSAVVEPLWLHELLDNSRVSLS